jgi:hypothetical protein
MDMNSILAIGGVVFICGICPTAAIALSFHILKKWGNE